MLANPNVPKLKTELIEPLFQLEKHFIDNCQVIQDWFDEQWQLTTPPVYGSVDLRNAGFKLAPIDMNLFPAGFNNLNPNFLALSVKAAKKIIHTIEPSAKNILVIPESHTRNLFYWANIKTLQHPLEQSGFIVRFGLVNSAAILPETITLASGESVIV